MGRDENPRRGSTKQGASLARWALPWATGRSPERSEPIPSPPPGYFNLLEYRVSSMEYRRSCQPKGCVGRDGSPSRPLSNLTVNRLPPLPDTGRVGTASRHSCLEVGARRRRVRPMTPSPRSRPSRAPTFYVPIPNGSPRHASAHPPAPGHLDAGARVGSEFKGAPVVRSKY
jgi:hypothetical protein